MKFFEDLLTATLTNSDILAFISAMLAIVVSIYISKKEASISFIRERHDKLFSPLFSLLEPVLYQKMDEKILADALQIIETNKNIIDGKLLEISFLCNKTPSQSNYAMLCSYIDKMYDKSCFKLGLKLRTLSYRIERKQYINKFVLFFYFLACIVLSFSMGIAILYGFVIVFALIATLLNQIITSNNPLLIFVLLFLLWNIFSKTIGRH